MEMDINEKIVALGVGRKGCQAIEYMHRFGKVDGVKIADMRFRDEPDALGLFSFPLKFNVQNIDDCKKIIDDNFKHADIIFVIGDGPLAPCVAKAAKDSGILTIGIALSHNEELKAMLKDASDALISLETEIGWVKYVVENIVTIITKPGFVNLDCDDVKSTLQDVGTAFIGTGRDNRAKIAALQAANMCRDVRNAKRVLLNITTGSEVSSTDMSNASEIIEWIAAPDAQVIFGHVIDDDMRKDVQVTFIAGMDDKINIPTQNIQAMEELS